MSDRWYYSRAGQTLGPATAEQLRQLALAGHLRPDDLIWPEGADRSQAIEAEGAVDFSTPAAPPSSSPDWLSDVRDAEQKTSAPSPAALDWLDDVREVEEALISLSWDAEAAQAEVTAAEELLREEEEPPPSPKAAPAVPRAAPTSAAPAKPVPPPPPVSAAPAKPMPTAAPVTANFGKTVALTAPVSPASAASKAAAPAVGSCRLALGSATSRGCVRDRNEDSLLVQHCAWSNLDRWRDAALVVVADGMGGHLGGDRASGLVIRAMGGVLAPLLTAALDGQGPEPTPAVLAGVLERGLNEANRIVLEISKKNTACKGMGSTAVALLIWDSHAYISLIGDCRVYHWRAGGLTQVTRDQTLVARMVELGQLTQEEAVNHPRRNEVAQAIGKFSRIEPARYELALSPGDWLIASCDGLYAHVDDQMLAEAIGKAGSNAAGLAQQLVEMANQGGGSDNCTVVAVRCS